MIASDVKAKGMPADKEVNLGTEVSSPIVSVSPIDESIIEGGTARYRIHREHAVSVTCAIRWRVFTNVDIILGPTTGVVNFDPGDTDVQVSVTISNLSGSQGDRFLQVSLEEPLGCVISPTQSNAQVKVIDSAAVAKWGNGYSDRVKIRLKATSGSSADGAIAWIVETYSEMRSSVYGGRVLSAYNPTATQGINLAGGEFDANSQATLPGTYGTHYSYPTNYTYWAGKGMGAYIRLPFRMERIERIKGTLDATEVGRLTTSLNAAAAAGCRVNLDAHNYCHRWDGAGTKEIIGGPGSSYTTADFAKFWELMAIQFGSHAAFTGTGGFGLNNEPSNIDAASGLWQTNANAAIVAIRATGYTGRIYCCGDSFATASRWDAIGDRMINVVDSGNNLWFEAHQYFDENGDGIYNRPASREFPPTFVVDSTRSVSRVNHFLDWLRINNKNGVIGEFGAPVGDFVGAAAPYTHDKTVASAWEPTIRNFVAACNAANVPTFAWAGGERWSAAYEMKLSPAGTVDDLAMAMHTAVPGSSTIPRDVRIEVGGDSNGSGGTKLNHRVRHYDPTTGKIVIAYSIPSTMNLSLDTNEVWMYFGKAGLTASEENIPGLAADHYNWWTLPDGADLIGGKALTVANVTQADVNGPAAVWTTSSTASNADPSHFQGVNNVTTWAIAEVDSSIVGQERGILNVGTPGVGSAAKGFNLGSRVAFSSSVTNSWFMRLTLTGGDQSFVGPDSSYKAGLVVICASRAPTSPIIGSVNGGAMIPASANTLTGGIEIAAGTTIQLGKGPRNTGTWVGKIVEVGVAKKSWPSHVQQLFEKSFLLPHEAYGSSQPQPYGTQLGLIAMPVFGGTNYNTAIDLDVIGPAILGGDGLPPDILSVSGSVGGTFTIITDPDVGKLIHYVPTPSFTGKASATFVLSTTGFVSTSVVGVAVITPPVSVTAKLSISADRTSMEKDTAEADVTFTINRADNLVGVSTVVWTKSGTAPNSDFVTGTVFTKTETFADGADTIAVSMTLKSGAYTASKTVTVTLSAPTNATLVTGATSDTTTVTVPTPTVVGAAEWYANPGHVDGCHHRMIGEGAVYGAPPGVLFSSFATGGRNYIGGGQEGTTAGDNIITELRKQCGRWELATNNQGRKAFHWVKPTDAKRLMKLGNYNSNTDTWTVAASGEQKNIRMPAGSTVRAGNATDTQIYYYTYNGSDFVTGFYPRDGVYNSGSNMCDVFTDFDWERQFYGTHDEWEVSAIDNYEKFPNGGRGASQIRFPPALILRGPEINPTNPGPILHCLQATVTRHNNQKPVGADDSCHFINKTISWPAKNIDNGAKSGPSAAGANKGDLPYGTLVCIKRGAGGYNQAKTAIDAMPAAKISAKARAYRLLECMVTNGMYMTDGQGEWFATSDAAGAPSRPKYGSINIRCDHETACYANGYSPAAMDQVATDVRWAMACMIPYMTCLFNARKHDITSDFERANDGYCYNGGGGRMKTGFNDKGMLPPQYYNNALAVNWYSFIIGLEEGNDTVNDAGVGNTTTLTFTIYRIGTGNDSASSIDWRITFTEADKLTTIVAGDLAAGQAQSGTLTWAAGDAAKKTVPGLRVKGGTAVATDEKVEVRTSNPSANAKTSHQRATITIKK
jgi:endoglucanase